MADSDTSGGFSMTTADAVKYCVILLAAGGWIARYEITQADVAKRLTNIETHIAVKDDLLRRATAVIEDAEADRPSPKAMRGVGSGASSRRGR